MEDKWQRIVCVGEIKYLTTMIFGARFWVTRANKREQTGRDRERENDYNYNIKFNMVVLKVIRRFSFRMCVLLFGLFEYIVDVMLLFFLCVLYWFVRWVLFWNSLNTQLVLNNLKCFLMWIYVYGINGSIERKMPFVGHCNQVT